MSDALTSRGMSPELLKVVERARGEPEGRFNSLAHLLDVSALERSFHRLRKDAAVGVDGVTKEAYGEALCANLADLQERLRSKRYRHQALRRVHIPKGMGQWRPIGVSALEDKIVQDAVREVLEAVYEQDFLDCSYGFRPKRSAHDAVRALTRVVHRGKVSWVLEADIVSFFDSLDRARLKEMLQARVADGSLLRLIGKCLHVGVLDGEEYSEPERGTTQGSVLSPLLGNVYLHYVLDAWFEREVKPRLRGTATLIRYADDCAPRRRTGGRKPSVQPCCTRDGGRPPEAAVQAEASNHPLLLPSREVVVRELGKGRARPGQVRTVESNASEPLMKCRKRRDDVKTGGESLSRDQSGGNLSTAQAASGMKAARTRSRLLCGTWEPVTPMPREKRKGKPPKRASTDAGYRDGATCSSDEGPVTGLKRRGCPIRSGQRRQPAMGGLP